MMNPVPPSLAAAMAPLIAAGLVGLILGLALGRPRRQAPAQPRQATAAGDFVRSVARAIGVDPRVVSLAGLSVDAAVGDRIATVLFQAVALDQSPDDIRRAIVDAIRRNVLAAQADADRRLTQALDALRDDLVRVTDAPIVPGGPPALSAVAVAQGAADRITAALGDWADATVPGVTIEVESPGAAA